MLFRKRRRPPHIHTHPSHPAPAPELYYIDYDMMIKGAKIKRGRRMVRQYAVILDGSVRLVTSGDTVERAVYDALVAAGAVAPRTPPDPAPEAPGKKTG